MAAESKSRPTIKDIYDKLSGLETVTKEHTTNINTLMAWKIATDAVNEYKAREHQNHPAKPSGGGSGGPLAGNLARALLVALGVIVTLATIIASTKG
jgi:hypothetical protein